VARYTFVKLTAPKLAASVAALLALLVVATSPHLLGSHMGRALDGLAGASRPWLALAGVGFLASVLCAVAAWRRAIRTCGGEIAPVESAARWHDLGKVELRFQAMLCGGDEYEAMLVDEPLAKSGIDPADRTAYRVASQRSGLPRGARHEAWSAALVREHLAQASDSYGFDPDLVIHLVASHHGRARPWLPPVIDGNPRDIEVLLTDSTTGPSGTKVVVSSSATFDFDHPARFARLNNRYGRWGLALLESIVRCADMTVSGEGS